MTMAQSKYENAQCRAARGRERGVHVGVCVKKCVAPKRETEHVAQMFRVAVDEMFSRQNMRVNVFACDFWFVASFGFDVVAVFFFVLFVLSRIFVFFLLEILFSSSTWAYVVCAVVYYTLFFRTFNRTTIIRFFFHLNELE